MELEFGVGMYLFRQQTIVYGHAAFCSQRRFSSWKSKTHYVVSHLLSTGVPHISWSQIQSYFSGLKCPIFQFYYL